MFIHVKIPYNVSVLFFLFRFQEKIKFPIFLSQWPFSLFIGKTCLSDCVFSGFFFACAGFIKFEKICLSDRIFSQIFLGKNTVTETEKLVIYLQKKNGKIIVSGTVNSVALLQKNTSQWQTFGEMKLKIKKNEEKKQ